LFKLTQLLLCCCSCCSKIVCCYVDFRKI